MSLLLLTESPLFDVFYLFRVFLRAVNQFTSVLNRFFLDQANFELQVIVLFFWIFLWIPDLLEELNPTGSRLWLTVVPLLMEGALGSFFCARCCFSFVILPF